MVFYFFTFQDKESVGSVATKISRQKRSIALGYRNQFRGSTIWLTGIGMDASRST